MRRISYTLGPSRDMVDRELLRQGWFSYKGYITMQHPNITECFKELFRQTKPVRVLEIGTSHAGLTLLLRDILDELGMNSTKIITWDIHDIGKTNIESLGYSTDAIEFRVENIFNYGEATLIPEKHDGVASIIASEGTTIVLCDGANKMHELTALSPLLKSGDVIMGHDYHPDKELLNSMSNEEKLDKNLWLWCETWDSDLKVPADVIPYMKSEFTQVAWLCMRRA